MEHRKMGALDACPALLGFGCMRFPLTPEGKIDEPEAARMIGRAMEAGITYYDTAYSYHQEESERFLGRVLPQYPRASYYLATKLPVWLVKTADDASRLFAEQLAKLNQEYIDFYLLHALDRERWQNMLRLGVVDDLLELKRQGKIRWLGFSFHDVYDTFEEIIRFRDWDFCQIQLNYMDANIQAGLKGLALARRLGVPVVVMEPVKGGSLTMLPEDIRRRLAAVCPERTPAAWALDWVAEQPGVSVILSGMSSMAQLEENLATFENRRPFTPEETQAVADAAAEFDKRLYNGCTGCKYCLPCPRGVNIPKCFSIWNDFGKFGNEELMKDSYFYWLDAGQRADRCVGCRQCESLCPQRIPISRDLKRLSAELAPYAPSGKA